MWGFHKGRMPLFMESVVKNLRGKKYLERSLNERTSLKKRASAK